MKTIPWLAVAWLTLVAAPLHGQGRQVRVGSSAELRAALADLKPGTTLLLAPGEYSGGLFLRGVAGTEAARVVIRGSDPARPPLFTGGGGTAWMLSDCSYLTLSHLAVRGYSGNGINVDDGGTFDTPARHLVLENLTITETGPRGNHDALKLSGLDDFTVRGCRFEGWGGSAIDMVGCHRGVIEDCRFSGREGFSQANAVQMKGGSSDILVQTSVFREAGERAINLGGSTGLAYFRPKPGEYEASRITVSGNRFHGSLAPVAWVNADGGRFVQNTIVNPGRWVLRILQENRSPGFKPCRGGVFAENLVVYDGQVASVVNVGPDTAPETFTLRRNAWFRTRGESRPSFPVPETDGVYGVDPVLQGGEDTPVRVTSRDVRLQGIGADAYVRPAK